MLAFWVTLIKVIAPWVAAAVVIHYLNVYNEKKYPEFYNSDNENNPKSLFEDFEIGYPFALAFIMYVGLFFIGGAFIYVCINDPNQIDVVICILYGVFIGIYIFAVLGIHVWKIWVKGEKSSIVVT